MTHSVVSPSGLRWRAAPLWSCAALLLCVVPAFAADSPQGGPSDAVFVAQLVLLMLVGRLLGEAMQRIGQIVPKCASLGCRLARPRTYQAN